MLGNLYYIIFIVTTILAVLITATCFILNQGKQMLIRAFRYKADIDASKEYSATFLIIAILYGCMAIIIGLLSYSLFLPSVSTATNKTYTNKYQLIYLYPILICVITFIVVLNFRKTVVNISEGRCKSRRNYGRYIRVLFISSLVFLPLALFSIVNSQFYIERDNLQSKIYSIIGNGTNLVNITSTNSKEKADKLLVKVNNDNIGYVNIGPIYKQKDVNNVEIKTNNNLYGEMSLNTKKDIKNGDIISIWNGNKKIGSSTVEVVYYKFWIDMMPELIGFPIIDYLITLILYSILNIYKEIQDLEMVKILYNKNGQEIEGRIIFDTGSFILFVDNENNYEYINKNEICKISIKKIDTKKQGKERKNIMSNLGGKSIKYKICIIALLVLVLIPILINYFLKSNDDSWISFWGSYLGGVATIGAVVLSINKTNEVQTRTEELSKLSEKNKINANAVILETDLKMCIKNVGDLVVRYAIENSHIVDEQNKRCEWILDWKEIIRGYVFDDKWRDTIKNISSELNISTVQKLYDIYTVLERSNNYFTDINKTPQNYKKLYKMVETIPRECIFSQEFLSKYDYLKVRVSEYDDLDKLKLGEEEQQQTYQRYKLDIYEKRKYFENIQNKIDQNKDYIISKDNSIINEECINILNELNKIYSNKNNA